MDTHYINKKHILLITTLIVITIIFVVILKFDSNTKVELGDQAVLFNTLNEDGVEGNSILAIYNSELSKQKMIMTLDNQYYSVDQINNTLNMRDENTLVFRAYNESCYQDVSLDLKDNTLTKSKIVKEQYLGDEKIQINVFADGKFELSKPNLYMVIDDPNLSIDSVFYSLSDIAQITNYVKY